MNFKGVEICCPHCQGELRSATNNGDPELCCGECDRRYPVLLGIPDLRVFPDPYISMEDDRAKGLLVGERLDKLSFPELVEYYYSMTTVVPPHHAQQYSRGLMAAPARAEGAFDSWEQFVEPGQKSATQSLLEIGCGTAPALVAAQPRYERVIGVDIAFRWLVVAKKRLAEAGLDIPLLCACAEALPFRNQEFDCVVMESTLEMVAEQTKCLAESFRVMRTSGYLFVSTPNQYSIGPDPHTGVWAGGYWPEKWMAAHVQRQGGIPPKRQLLSATHLYSKIRRAGFNRPTIVLPDVPQGQSMHFGFGLKALIQLYHIAKRLPIMHSLLRHIGPMLHAVAKKS